MVLLKLEFFGNPTKENMVHVFSCFLLIPQVTFKHASRTVELADEVAEQEAAGVVAWAAALEVEPVVSQAGPLVAAWEVALVVALVGAVALLPWPGGQWLVLVVLGPASAAGSAVADSAALLEAAREVVAELLWPPQCIILVPQLVPNFVSEMAIDID